MSASEFDERKDGLDVSRYAPPQYRRPDGRVSIGPVLERLSRGPADGEPPAATAQAVPPAEAIHMPNAPSSPRFPLSMTARLAAAMSLAAVLAAVSVAFLPSQAEHPAPVASTDARQPMETVGVADKPNPVRPEPARAETSHADTSRREMATTGEAQASADLRQPAPSLAPSTATVAERIDALATTPASPGVDTARALTASLKMWDVSPSDPSADGWRSAAALAKTGGGDANDATSQQAALRQQRAKAANQARRRRFTRHHRARAVAAKPQQQPQQKPVETAQNPANADQPPKKNLLKAALNAIFGSGDDSGDTASGSPAPATGAAFQ